MSLLFRLVDLLPARLQPVAKALVPGVVTVAAVGWQWADTGTLDTGELTTAVLGLVTVLLTFLIPNKQR
jgi:hypothetical protein